MRAVASSEILQGVVETEPGRIWFGLGGCVEKRDDASFAVYVRGEMLGVFDAEDVASRDVLIAVVLQDNRRVREEVARAFRVSPATVGRVVTRHKRGGFRAVADTGHVWTVRTPKLEQRLAELFEQGYGPRRAHRVVAKLASYGTVQSLHARWLADRAERRANEAAPVAQPGLSLLVPAGSPAEAAPGEPAVTTGAEVKTDRAPAVPEQAAPVAQPELSLLVPADRPAEITPVEPATATVVQTESGRAPAVPGQATTPARGELTLEEVTPLGQGVVQHLGSWMVLGMLNALGIYELAEGCRGEEVSSPSLRVAMDAVAIALAIGQKCVEGVRRIETPSAGTLLRWLGGVSASWVRWVLHSFADAGSVAFQATVASRLLVRSTGGENSCFLYVDNHLRPYTGQHRIRYGWRMQNKRAVPGTSDFYIHDEMGCPLWRVSTPAHDSLCAWLKPVVDFARKSLGEKVRPVLIFDRGGAFPEAMAELRDAQADFVTYERRPFPELGATEFTESLSITLALLSQEQAGKVADLPCLQGDGELSDVVEIYCPISPVRRSSQLERRVVRFGEAPGSPWDGRERRCAREGLRDGSS